MFKEPTIDDIIDDCVNHSDKSNQINERGTDPILPDYTAMLHHPKWFLADIIEIFLIRSLSIHTL